MLILERIRLWREDAAVLRRRGARRAAALLERVAAELEEDVRGQEAPQLVDLARAVQLSGYTRGHLRRMLAQGSLTNHGTDAHPLIAAADLPRKPTRPARSPATRAQLVAEVLGR